MRSMRRHHRERVIRNRERAAKATAISDYQGKHPRGALADSQYWRGCNTPNCGLCHPWKRWGRARDRSYAGRAGVIVSTAPARKLGLPIYSVDGRFQLVPDKTPCMGYQNCCTCPECQERVENRARLVARLEALGVLVGSGSGENESWEAEAA